MSKRKKNNHQPRKRTPKLNPEPIRSLVLVQPNEMLQEIAKLIGDIKLAMFFLEWIRCDRNATRAYQNLNPHVTDGSAKVLGNLTLSKIPVMEILSTFDLGVERYFRELDEGLKATKLYGKDAIEHPDYSSRRKYHEALGQILGVESKGVTVQNNQFNFAKLEATIIAARQERGLE